MSPVIRKITTNRCNVTKLNGKRRVTSVSTYTDDFFQGKMGITNENRQLFIHAVKFGI